MSNPFQNALMQLFRATSVQPFPKAFIDEFSTPKREVRISIPVKLDNGETRVFEGYRVEHNNALGPYKGGIRYHHETDSSEVKALAFWMALKCAIANIPMGGGKGGITVNPRELSKKELEALSRGWVRGMADILGPKKDVPAPDVNTTPEIMDWMVDEYEKITGDKTKATFTGKSLTNGGSAGRGPATGLGGYYVFRTLALKYGIQKGASVVIQGMGNVGGNAGEIFEREGYTIVAISDSKGGIYNASGLKIAEVFAYKKEKGTLAGFPGAQEVTNNQLLELPCDVLIPAALENQITIDNVARVQAKFILELANGPLTPDADEELFKRGVPVVPDILANAGGVTVSTYEWEQNLKGEQWSEADVFAKLDAQISRETLVIYERAQALKTDLRRAAFIVALERIAKAMGYSL